MKIISIVNIKGGVGKTTSAINLSACLAEQGYRVLLTDLDSQANSTMSMKAYNIDDLSVADILIDKNLDIRKVIKKTDFENLDILPSNIKLSFTEKNILLDTTRSQQNRLKKALMKIESDYDYCIIDCPPSLNIITINALCATKEVLVPIKIDKFALDGLEYLLESIEDIKEEFNSELNLKGCFITMDSATTVNKIIKEQLKNFLEDKMLSVSVKQNVKVVESTFKQLPVVFYNKNAMASKNYKDLCKEIF